MSTKRRLARAVRRLGRLPAGARPPGIVALAESLAFDLPRIQAKLERWGVEGLSNDELALARLLAADAPEVGA